MAGHSELIMRGKVELLTYREAVKVRSESLVTTFRQDHSVRDNRRNIDQSFKRDRTKMSWSFIRNG